MDSNRDDLDDSISDLWGGDPIADALSAPLRDEPLPEPPLHTEKCSRCRGTGTFYSYSGRPLGPCRACKGQGSNVFKQPRAVRERNRATAEARKNRKHEENIEAFKAANPERWAWMEGAAERGFDFALSLMQAVTKYGALTEKQAAAVDRAISKQATRAAEAKAAAADAPTIDMSTIVAMFETAIGNGSKKPTYRAEGVVISRAPDHGKNAGALYVKTAGGEYQGKILPDSRFMATRDAADTTLPALQTIAADPGKAAVRYGRQVGACSCCGRELTDANSIAMGIGPVCAAKFGF